MHVHEKSKKAREKEAEEGQSEVKELEKPGQEKDRETEKLKARIADLENELLRQRADLDNYCKHLDREKSEFMRCANEKLILDLLEVADNFERALPELKKKDEESALGMEMIYKQLMKIMEKAGLKQVEALGKKFDPYSHEAFLQQECDEADGTVLEELQKGYTLNQKVIRHAKVKVAKGKG